MSASRTLSVVVLLALHSSPCAAETGKSPKEEQKAFRLPTGLRIELVASEPQIESPVAMAFDEDGKLWVVEMRDYPNGPKPGEKPQGRIMVLEDKDGDGFYETATVFADNLLFANGIMPWKGGVIVTMAPQIVYFHKDGTKEVLYEGFAAGNPQLRVSHPVLGLDGWVYVANGLRGGKVRRVSPGVAPPGVDPVTDISGRDFRFNLLTGQYEALSGMGQYGNCFDDRGHRFVCDNRHHLRHVVIEDRYLKRNPYLAAPAVVQDISELDKEEGPLSSGGRVYPISKNWTTSSLHAGHFTAACGVHIYEDVLLPKEYRGCAFTCEPTGNLVHQEVLTPDGATFRSKPAKEGVEFLASTDDWFRPVFLSEGPDGALYVVDMYRAVIEHPEWMPPELKNRPDLTWGKDKGRIWRIVPEGHKTTKGQRPTMSKAGIDPLLLALSVENAWWRTTAHRLLLEGLQGPARPERLEDMALRGNYRWNIPAAWLLEALHRADDSVILGMLDRPQNVETALTLAERKIGKSLNLQKRLTERVDDFLKPGEPWAFRLALTLGQWDSDEVIPPLSKIALANDGDRWTRLAVESSVANRSGNLIASLLKNGLTKEASEGRFALLRELAAVAGARQNQNEIAPLLQALAAIEGAEAARWQMTGLDGLTEGMGRRGPGLSAVLRGWPANLRPAAAVADKLLAEAAKVAADPKADPGERLTAIRLTAHAPWASAEPVLAKLVSEDGPQDLRLAAVRALSAHPNPAVARILMKSWTAYPPALRREVTEAMLRQPDRTLFLLGEIEAKRVRPADLDSQRQRQLVNSPRAEIRDKAKKLLRDGLPADRKKVLEQYAAALKVKGDPAGGRRVFKQNCATCHRLAGEGVNVGPNIADAERTRTAEALLNDILNPNAAIDANYIAYVVTLKNGKVLTGIIAAETATSITLKRAENQTDTVLRQDVEEVRSMAVSLMPEGLEKSITVEEMGDLLAFLKSWRYLDGSVPGK
ncbi:MAG TPA: PVC-type heme-binding CxxCH protein [Gemmataceae bacterium]|nr:PVC-type heme-binding CxxCH protein [Gemmataceae bacterium]